jgi:hypothetical protein
MGSLLAFRHRSHCVGMYITVSHLDGSNLSREAEDCFGRLDAICYSFYFCYEAYLGSPP